MSDTPWIYVFGGYVRLMETDEITFEWGATWNNEIKFEHVKVTEGIFLSSSLVSLRTSHSNDVSQEQSCHLNTDAECFLLVRTKDHSAMNPVFLNTNNTRWSLVGAHLSNTESVTADTAEGYRIQQIFSSVTSPTDPTQIFFYLHLHDETCPAGEQELIRATRIEVLAADSSKGWQCQTVLKYGIRRWPGKILFSGSPSSLRESSTVSLFTYIFGESCCDTVKPQVGTVKAPSVHNFAKELGIAGSVLTLGIMAPFAAVAAVQAIGFGAGGVMGGSMAAGMMSAEAIAGGGAIAAGGTVATLQSLGAAGLGLAGTAAASSVGAATGAALGLGGASISGVLGSAPSSSNTLPPAQGVFTVICGEWANGIQVYEFVGEQPALHYFDKVNWCTRVLFDSEGKEMKSGHLIADPSNARGKIINHWVESGERSKFERILVPWKDKESELESAVLWFACPPIQEGSTEATLFKQVLTGANLRFTTLDLKTPGGAAATSSPTVFNDGQYISIFYVSADKKLHELYRHEKVGSHWVYHVPSLEAKLARDPNISPQVVSLQNGKGVFYVSGSHTICEIYIGSFTCWQWRNIDLTSESKAPLVLEGTEIHAACFQGVERVLFINNDRHVCELFYLHGKWTAHPIVAANNRPQVKESHPAFEVHYSGETRSVFYLDEEGCIQELYHHATGEEGAWKWFKPSDCSPVRALHLPAVLSMNTDQPYKRMVFLGVDKKVHQFFINPDTEWQWKHHMPCGEAQPKSDGKTRPILVESVQTTYAYFIGINFQVVEMKTHNYNQDDWSCASIPRHPPACGDLVVLENSREERCLFYTGADGDVHVLRRNEENWRHMVVRDSFQGNLKSNGRLVPAVSKIL